MKELNDPRYLLQDAKYEAIMAGSQALPVGDQSMNNAENDRKEYDIDQANGLKTNDFNQPGRG